VPRLIRFPCIVRCIREISNTTLSCWFCDVQRYSYVHSASHSENIGLFPLSGFPFWQKINTVKTSALSSGLMEITQLIQRLGMGGDDVRNHLIYTMISSGNKIRIYGFLMTQHRQCF